MEKPNTIIENEANLENHKIEKYSKLFKRSFMINIVTVFISSTLRTN